MLLRLWTVLESMEEEVELCYSLLEPPPDSSRRSSEGQLPSE